MSPAEEIAKIPVYGLARMRDRDAFLAEWIWPGDDETMQMRLHLAYLKGMIETHIRAQDGEEPRLKVVPDEE